MKNWNGQSRCASSNTQPLAIVMLAVSPDSHSTQTIPRVNNSNLVNPIRHNFLLLSIATDNRATYCSHPPALALRNVAAPPTLLVYLFPPLLLCSSYTSTFASNTVLCTESTLLSICAPNFVALILPSPLSSSWAGPTHRSHFPVLSNSLRRPHTTISSNLVRRSHQPLSSLYQRTLVHLFHHGPHHRSQTS